MRFNKLLLLAAALFVCGCASNKTKVVQRAQGPIQWPDGKLLEERVELNFRGKPEALFTVYRDSAGNFIRHGYSRHYYLNGQLKFEERFKDGKLDSLTDFWYENGAKQGELPFKNGKPHGLALTWHPNGMKKTEKPWVDGKLHGLAREWDKKGKLIRQEWWANNARAMRPSTGNPADGSIPVMVDSTQTAPTDSAKATPASPGDATAKP